MHDSVWLRKMSASLNLDAKPFFPTGYKDEHEVGERVSTKPISRYHPLYKKTDEMKQYYANKLIDSSSSVLQNLVSDFQNFKLNLYDDLMSSGPDPFELISKDHVCMICLNPIELYKMFDHIISKHGNEVKFCENDQTALTLRDVADDKFNILQFGVNTFLLCCDTKTEILKFSLFELRNFEDRFEFQNRSMPAQKLILMVEQDAKILAVEPLANYYVIGHKPKFAYYKQSSVEHFNLQVKLFNQETASTVLKNLNQRLKPISACTTCGNNGSFVGICPNKHKMCAICWEFYMDCNKCTINNLSPYIPSPETTKCPRVPCVWQGFVHELEKHLLLHHRNQCVVGKRLKLKIGSVKIMIANSHVLLFETLAVFKKIVISATLLGTKVNNSQQSKDKKSFLFIKLSHQNNSIGTLYMEDKRSQQSSTVINNFDLMLNELDFELDY